MLDYVAAGLNALNTAREIAKGISSLKEDVAVQMKAAELLTIIADVQGSLNDAQAKIYELQEELRQAKESLSKRADFDRYELYVPYEGTTIYRLKGEEQRDGEPITFICPVCKDDGLLGLLDYRPPFAVCKRCKRDYKIGESKPVGRQMRTNY